MSGDSHFTPAFGKNLIPLHNATHCSLSSARNHFTVTWWI